MTLVPQSVSRFGYRSILKLKYNSPTIMVVSGVIGLGAAAVLAAKATRELDPILDDHAKRRIHLEETVSKHGQTYNKDLARLYAETGWEMTKLYGPALFIGGASAFSVLTGHRILRGRHIATMAAYSGLIEQMAAYRTRVAATVGEDIEAAIFEGARGEWSKEGGISKLEKDIEPVFDQPLYSFDRPWFSEQTTPSWQSDPTSNYLFLKGVQAHMNNILPIRGHVMLNDVYDALGMARRPEGAVVGWLYGNPKGTGHIDFGFMAGIDPNTKAFRAGQVRDVQLNFNHEGPIWEHI